MYGHRQNIHDVPLPTTIQNQYTQAHLIAGTHTIAAEPNEFGFERASETAIACVE